MVTKDIESKIGEEVYETVEETRTSRFTGPLQRAGVSDARHGVEYTHAFYTENSDDKIGEVEYIIFGDCCVISWVYVNDSYRGHGLGSRLRKYALGKLKVEGCTEAFTNVVSEYARPIAEDQGFTEDSRFDGEWLSKKL